MIFSHGSGSSSDSSDGSAIVMVVVVEKYIKKSIFVRPASSRHVY